MPSFLRCRFAAHGPAADRAALLAHLEAHLKEEEGFIVLGSAQSDASIMFYSTDDQGCPVVVVWDDGECVTTAWGKCLERTAECHVAARELTTRFARLTIVLLTEDESWDMYATRYAAGAVTVVAECGHREGSAEEAVWMRDMLAQA